MRHHHKSHSTSFWVQYSVLPVLVRVLMIWCWNVHRTRWLLSDWPTDFFVCGVTMLRNHTTDIALLITFPINSLLSFYALARGYVDNLINVVSPLWNYVKRAEKEESRLLPGLIPNFDNGRDNRSPNAPPTPADPTLFPTPEPTPDPTLEPTPFPSLDPTSEPTPEPTLKPTPIQHLICTALSPPPTVPWSPFRR